MKIKLTGGPMDGAVYALSLSEPSTTRKPDGISFDSQEPSTGRWMKEEYVYDNCVGDGTHVALVYKYDGQVVDVHSVPMEPDAPEEESP